MNLSISYIDRKGETAEEQIETHVRPIMNWVKTLVTDPGLCSIAQWYPTKKYLKIGSKAIEMKDNIENGDDWWENQVRAVLEILEYGQRFTHLLKDKNWR